MSIILPIASGKGGVGKTAVCANLGIAFARLGKSTLLIDLDLGGSNLHTCLGIKNSNNGIGSYIYKQVDSLSSLILSTDIPDLQFIPGDTMLAGTANLPFFTKKKILKEIMKIPADYVLIDLGSGTSYNTLDFFLVSESGILITNPQTTSLLNAYSFIKSALLRLIFRSFPPRTEERETIKQFITRRLEGTDSSLYSLVSLLGAISPDSESIIRKKIKSYVPRVIMNMGKSQNDFAIGAKLKQIVRKNLELEVEYIGFLGYDDIVDRSIAERKPASILHPQSNFTKTIELIANKILSSGGNAIDLYDDEENIHYLGETADTFTL